MNVADICPVGALTTKDFRFKIRVWFLEDVPGICTGCSAGCNVHLGVANNRVYRYQPRRNDDVNDTWICDKGRMSYREIGSADRLQRCAIRSDDGRLETSNLASAVEISAARLAKLVESKGAGVIAGIASPHATTEDLFTFRRFLSALGSETSGVAVIRGDSDDILVREEKAANAAGARAVGFADAKTVVDRISSGGVDAVVILGHDALHESLLGGAEPLGGLDTVIVLDTHVSKLEHVAHVMFPVRHAAEKHGTLVNADGRAQRVQPAVEPAWEAYSDGEVLSLIGAAMGLDGFDGRFDVGEVSRNLASENPAFAGIDIDSMGDGGVAIAADAGVAGAARSQSEKGGEST
jgi:NADH-quinone oxidoreductase subunit G